MTARVKLSELIAARAAMAPGQLIADEQTDAISGATVIRSTTCTCNGMRPSYIGHCPACHYVCDFAIIPEAAGIVATHNAADVLIEVAMAALRWVDEHRDGNDPIAEDEARWRLYDARDKVQL